MAGKKGRSGRKSKAVTRKPNRPAVINTASQRPTDSQAPATDTLNDFEAAVKNVLGTEPTSQGGTLPHGTASPGQTPASPPAAIADESFLAIDAWKALIEAPFTTAALWLGIPGLAALGRLRAEMLAIPSYPLYRHYVKKWLTDNPDDELFVAKVMTAGVLFTVLQEAYIICNVQWAANKAAKAAHVESPSIKVVMDQNINN
jgi:hypothetical protein